MYKYVQYYCIILLYIIFFFLPWWLSTFAGISKNRIWFGEVGDFYHDFWFYQSGHTSIAHLWYSSFYLLTAECSQEPAHGKSGGKQLSVSVFSKNLFLFLLDRNPNSLYPDRPFKCPIEATKYKRYEIMGGNTPITVLFLQEC